MTTLNKNVLTMAMALLIAVLMGCQSSTNDTTTATDAEPQTITADVCVYGGTSAGVIAGYTAKKMGLSVVVVEPTTHLGGLSASGLSSTDIGNKQVVTGMARKFYRDMGNYFNKLEQWDLVPSKAEAIFNKYTKEVDLKVLYQHRIIDGQKDGTVITQITVEDATNPGKANATTIKAKYFVDATYEGDLFPHAGVSYFVGREDNSVYNETLSGVQLRNKHQMPDGIDPYVVPGDSSSGLVWGINPKPIKPNGTGDKKMQAYNFRLCLTQDTTNQIAFAKPDNYDPATYELLYRIIKQRADKGKKQSAYDYMIINHMPEGKTDCNHLGGFSLDYIGGNHNYPEADYNTRQTITQEHIDYIKGFLWFLGHDPRLPEELKASMNSWGYAADEFEETNGFPHHMYVREGRRLVGPTVITEHHCLGNQVVNDPVAYAAYTMDSHNCDRHVVNGQVKNEGNVEVGDFPPFGIGYSSLLPKPAECTNLIVPVSMSASHIAFGSIRMEPVFMVMSQVAATAIALAEAKSISLHEVNYQDINKMFGQDPYLNGTAPDLVIDNEMSDLVSISGAWDTVSLWMRQYNQNMLFCPEAKKTDDLKVVFTIKPTHSGAFKGYFYCNEIRKDLPKLPTTQPITITDENGTTEAVLSIRENEGGWAEMGTFTFEKGKTYTATLNASKANGPAIADAIIFVANN